MDKKKLVEDYIACFFQMENAMKVNNWTLNNKNAKIMEKLFANLCETGREGLDLLKTYLNHDNHKLRCRVARDLLPFEEETALKVLKWLEKNSEEAGLSAKYVLQNWNEKK